MELCLRVLGTQELCSPIGVLLTQLIKFHFPGLSRSYLKGCLVRRRFDVLFV